MREMYEKFKFDRVGLSLIDLDDKNPRIVTPQRLTSPKEILSYFFEHEDLSTFVKMIAVEGRNPGAERPYVIRSGKRYVVVEGNTRIATYKLLTGQLVAPEEYVSALPHITDDRKEELLSVDVAIAPSRDALMGIMARAHFGRGDKSRWGYLGSRKAVYDDWKAKKSIAQLASVFDRTQAQIRDLLIEYELYLEALKLTWTPAEKELLLRPSIEFNPPVRFLQTAGHKQLMGIDFDRANVQVQFLARDAKQKFHHLIKKMAINDKGPGATASYAEVFADYTPPTTSPASAGGTVQAGSSGASTSSAAGSSTSGSSSSTSQTSTTATGSLKTGALFDYAVTKNNAPLRQLMKEAKGLNSKTFPAAGAGLLRSVVEVTLKVIIDDQNANTTNSLLSLETALSIAQGKNVKLGADDKRILKEFNKNHLEYINLGAHATVVPNYDRLVMARDCIAPFIMRNV
ncbi:hypothetical protein ASG11_04275 [Sphingomonas sp. Leaf357]|uniref:hypothetical protein n=1 Tax=Sphingomonas sp. Leaf357 TaxID=1736350 RepID=UPI0006F9C0DA|nr:hypothetical protein [Sphingomonas sp. Leaf357]KQS03567.1 hypothetical protein ASG11_04275 [Sphingomonas sp. Leaf357]